MLCPHIWECGAKGVKACLDPFKTAVPFGGQSTQNLAGLSPKRDCCSERDKVFFWRKSSAEERPPVNQNKNGQNVLLLPYSSTRLRVETLLGLPSRFGDKTTRKKKVLKNGIVVL